MNCRFLNTFVCHVHFPFCHERSCEHILTDHIQFIKSNMYMYLLFLQPFDMNAILPSSKPDLLLGSWMDNVCAAVFNAVTVTIKVFAMKVCVLLIFTLSRSLN